MLNQHLIRLSVLTAVCTLLTTPAVAQTPTPQSTALQAANAFNKQSMEFYQKHRYKDALKAGKNALTKYIEAHGALHIDVAVTLNNIGEFERLLGNYKHAEEAGLKGLKMRARLLGENHLAVATSCSNVAMVYAATGRPQQAIGLLHRALRIKTTLLGENHLDVADTLTILAELHWRYASYEDAEKVLRRTLDIQKKQLKTTHPALARTFNIWGMVAYQTGAYDKAVKMHRAALAIRVKALGKKHPAVGESVNNLGAVFQAKGQFKTAIKFFEVALEVLRPVLGNDHPRVAQSLNNLGLCYLRLGNYGRALPLLLQSLQLKEKALGPEHAEVALTASNLAMLYMRTGNTTDALPLLQRALKIRRKKLGPKHPATGNTLNTLGVVYLTQKRFREAQDSLEKGLKIKEHHLLPWHADISQALTNLGTVHSLKGDLATALPLFARAQKLHNRSLQEALSFGRTESINAALRQLVGPTAGAVTLAVKTKHPEAVRQAVEALLQRSGRAVDALRTAHRAVLSRESKANPKITRMLKIYKAARSELSLLNTKPPANLSAAELQRKKDTLLARTEGAMDELRETSKSMARTTSTTTIKSVAQWLEPDAAFIGYALYEPHRPEADSMAKRWGKPRYFAYVIRNNGLSGWADLGPHEPINALVKQFRAAIASRSHTVKTLGARLHTMTLEPLSAALSDARQLIISPDDQLNVLPFAALVDKQGKFLVETQTLRNVTSARDLIVGGSPKTTAPPIILANPTYKTHKTADANGTKATDINKIHFSPLPGTAKESKLLRAQLNLSSAQVHTGIHATERLLKKVASPRVLHIATHGFFLPLIEAERTDAWNDPSTQYHRLMRSGLALAGANNSTAHSKEDDGIVTALEMADLNLMGTELVVLSACETGAGKVEAGFGVYGLKRSLVIAGARTQVVSLWKVDDSATQATMNAYYGNLLQGKDRIVALNQVQRDMLTGKLKPTTKMTTGDRGAAALVGSGATDVSQTGWMPPYFWAAFTANGANGPIDFK